MSNAAAAAGHAPRSGRDWVFPGASSRIERMRRRYQTGPNFISTERAALYTEGWKRTEGQGYSQEVRVARAMRDVFAGVTHHVDPDERLAGSWTECFLGFPVDIERGLFNGVLAAELTRGDMLRARLISLARVGYYIARNGKLREFWRNQSYARAAGRPALNLGLETLSERDVNPFQITEESLHLLRNELLPYWRGRTLMDDIQKALFQSRHFSKGMADFSVALPGNTSRQALMLTTSAALVSFQAHIIPGYDRVINRGLLAMREEVERCVADGAGGAGERSFLQAQLISFDGMILFCRRLALHLRALGEAEPDPARRLILEGMASGCQRVPLEPATSFREAVQSLWTTKTMLELACPVYVNNVGRLDQILHPHYVRDVARGVLDADAARELLEELLLKIMSHQVRPESNIVGNFYHRFTGASPVTLAGVDAEGEDATNELSYLFVQAAHNSRAIFNCNIRVCESTPDDLLLLVAQCMREGTSSYSLFNDELHVEALGRRNFPLDDARNYALMGCVDATIPGKTGSMGACALLLCHLLDTTLRNGDSKLMAGTVHQDGLRTGDPDNFATFDELIVAFLTQGRHAIRVLVAGSDLRDRIYAEKLPAPHLSAFIDGCLDSRKDLTAGGCTYDLTGISFINSIANVVDSLYVIKKLVFEQRQCSIRELLEAMDCNFVGHEELHAQIRGLKGKWGNGHPETDHLAHAIMKELFRETRRYTTFRGGQVVNYVISMTSHTIDGRLSAATPDGRKFATPYAASCNPYNVERGGVTAVLRSVASLPLVEVHGSAVNVKFHPSAIGDNAATRAKWVALIRTYFRLGGSQIQPTVVSGESLRAAQADPDRYRDLIVKVGGYSAYFVDLGPDIQDEIIGRTEHRA